MYSVIDSPLENSQANCQSAGSASCVYVCSMEMSVSLQLLSLAFIMNKFIILRAEARSQANHMTGASETDSHCFILIAHHNISHYFGWK